MIQRLYPIKHRLHWLESLQIRTQNSSYLWPQELNIFEYAPQLRSFYLDHGIPHNMVKVPWNQLTELHARFEDLNGCLSALQLVPNLVKCAIICTSGWADSVSHTIPILRFPHLLFFYVSVSVDQPNQIFSHVQFPILHDIHVKYPADSNGQWLIRQPFISLLSHTSHTLRNLTVDCLSCTAQSTQIAHCLRSTPSLIQLTLHGSNGWLTAGLLLPLTCQSISIAAETYLLPRLEVLEMDDDTIIDSCIFADMIESRWRIVEGGRRATRLRSARLTLFDFEDDILDGETLEKLRRLRDQGIDIQIIGGRHHKRLNLLRPDQILDAI